MAKSYYAKSGMSVEGLKKTAHSWGVEAKDGESPADLYRRVFNVVKLIYVDRNKGDELPLKPCQQYDGAAPKSKSIHNSSLQSAERLFRLRDLFVAAIEKAVGVGQSVAALGELKELVGTLKDKDGIVRQEVFAILDQLKKITQTSGLVNRKLIAWWLEEGKYITLPHSKVQVTPNTFEEGEMYALNFRLLKEVRKYITENMEIIGLIAPEAVDFFMNQLVPHEEVDAQTAKARDALLVDFFARIDYWNGIIDPHRFTSRSYREALKKQRQEDEEKRRNRRLASAQPWQKKQPKSSGEVIEIHFVEGESYALLIPLQKAIEGFGFDRMRLPNDVYEAYEWLRNEGFIHCRPKGFLPVAAVRDAEVRLATLITYPLFMEKNLDRFGYPWCQCTKRWLPAPFVQRQSDVREGDQKPDHVKEPAKLLAQAEQKVHHGRKSKRLPRQQRRDLYEKNGHRPKSSGSAKPKGGKNGKKGKLSKQERKDMRKQVA